MVDLDQGSAIVTAHPTGQYAWLKEQAILQDADDIRRLEQRVRSAEPDLSRLLLRLEVRGMLSMAEHDLFDQMIARTGLAAALCSLDLDREHLIIRPSEEELDRLSDDRVVKETIRRLRGIAESEDHPKRQAATRAIQYLQLACHHRQREAAA